MNPSSTSHNIANSTRITRCCLIGTGIVSGFEVSLDALHHIRICPGTGITSDGKYIELTTNREFTFYRNVNSPISYPFFTSEEGDSLPLWELITDDEFKESDQPLSPQYNSEKLNPFLKDKVVLVYVEQHANYPTETDDYLLTNDDLADETNNKNYGLRFFLIRQEDVLQKLDISQISNHMVWNRLDDDDDYIYSDAYNPDDTIPRLRDLNKVLNPALRLAEIRMRRFGFSKGDPFDCPTGGPNESVFPSITSLDDIYNAYKSIIDETIPQLHKALQRMFALYGGVIDKFPAWNIPETIDILINKWEAFKRINNSDDTSIHKKEYIQYFYDWLRDLLKGYHEVRTLLIDYTFISLSGVNEYPLHFLLGQPLRDTVTNIPRPLRQHFKQAPIYNGQIDRLQKLRLYFWRILVSIKNFYLPDYIEPAKLNFCNTPIDDLEDEPIYEKIRITPGHFYDHCLEEQSIPYYYSPVARHKYSLHHFWNYERTRNSSSDEILCYHACDSEDSYTSKLHAIRPLHYNLDEFDFYRIEGFIGQAYKDLNNDSAQVTPGVKTQLHYLKQKYNLDFNFNAVKLNSNDPITVLWKEIMSYANEFNGFNAKLLGMEHLAGVKKGGTFILVCDEDGQVVSDFSLPHHCCTYIADDNDFTYNVIEGDNEDILTLIGTASPNEADDLERIKGIGPETKEVLHSHGIYTYSQVSKLNEGLFQRMNLTYYRRKNWLKEAASFYAEKKKGGNT